MAAKLRDAGVGRMPRGSDFGGLPVQRLPCRRFRPEAFERSGQHLIAEIIWQYLDGIGREFIHRTMRVPPPRCRSAKAAKLDGKIWSGQTIPTRLSIRAPGDRELCKLAVRDHRGPAPTAVAAVIFSNEDQPAIHVNGQY